jgi:osmoprotectant transport system permease protein
MFRFISIDKVSLVASTVGLAAILLTGFVIFRPNRLLGGESIPLLGIAGNIGVLVLLAWIVLLFISVFRVPERFKDVIMGPLALLLIPFCLALAARHATEIILSTGSIARVSLGPAFWISLFVLAVLVSEAWQRSSTSRLLTVAGATGTTVITFWLSMSGKLEHLSLVREYMNRQDRFFGELNTHLLLATSAVFIAAVIGVPLGILAHRRARLRGSVFLTLNTLQTVPSLALFGILIPILATLAARFPFLQNMGIQGIGTAPTLIALTVYSLLPVARNTYTGFEAVEPGIIDAGRGMGMTGRQLLFRVQFPVASPIILSGVRTALVQSIGLTAVAALIGAGGLGVFIFQGLGQAATDLILLGAIPTIMIAVVADALMNGFTELVKPRGLK